MTWMKEISAEGFFFSFTLSVLARWDGVPQRTWHAVWVCKGEDHPSAGIFCFSNSAISFLLCRLWAGVQSNQLLLSPIVYKPIIESWSIIKISSSGPSENWGVGYKFKKTLKLITDNSMYQFPSVPMFNTPSLQSKMHDKSRNAFHTPPRAKGIAESTLLRMAIFLYKNASILK